MGHAARSPMLLLPSLLLSLLGCGPARSALDRPALRPPVPLEDLRFSDAGAASQPDAWWRAFDAPELDALVARGLAQNLTVRAAFDRLAAAEAQVVQARAPLIPSLGADASVDAEVGGAATWGLGVGASYELDLWGRVRAEGRAAVYRRSAAEADARAAALSLSGEIARTWIAIAAARSQLDLLEQQIEANAGMTRIVRARFYNGVAREADALRQDRLLVRTREQHIAQREALAVLEHRLAVLLGSAPTEAAPEVAAALPAPPPLPDAGVPLELARSRPDVLAAERRLLAADAQVAAAITELFPRLTLSVELGATAASPADLLTGWITSLGAGLVAPLLEGRSRRAEVRRTRALLDAAIADYGAALLTALQEVEDALARNRYQAERVENIAEQVRLAERAVEGLQAQYAGGLNVGYLDVLTAQTTAQQLRRDLIDARARLLEVRVALYLALAGGIPEEAP